MPELLDDLTFENSENRVVIFVLNGREIIRFKMTDDGKLDVRTPAGLALTDAAAAFVRAIRQLEGEAISAVD